MLCGRASLYRPAHPEYMLDLWANTVRAFANIAKDDDRAFLSRGYLRTMVGCWLIPTFLATFPRISAS
jgi:hypothetical protein